jgi:hypothetical protein
MTPHPEITQIVEVFEETYPDLVTALGNRLHNAKVLVQDEVAPGKRSTIQCVTKDIYHVMSQEHFGQYHRVNVTEKTCTCPDAAAGRPCKHRLAVYIYKQLTDDPGDVYKRTLLAAKGMVDSKGYNTWKSKNPNTLLSYHQWKDHPLYGTVTYLHPINGSETVKVLARNLPDGITEVIAIHGSPFARLSHTNEHSFFTTSFKHDPSQEDK